MLTCHIGIPPRSASSKISTTTWRYRSTGGHLENRNVLHCSKLVCWSCCVLIVVNIKVPDLLEVKNSTDNLVFWIPIGYS